MSEPAPTYDDDGLDATMTLQDWLEVLESDIDEAADGVETKSEIERLVAFLRAKADEIAAIEPLEDFGDPEEECERDEEESE
jgi:hypothetical protein